MSDSGWGSLTMTIWPSAPGGPGLTWRWRRICLCIIGAKVFDFAWINDFAAARNEALSHATGDYAFWLDADDVVEPAEREKLGALFSGLGRASVGNTTGAMSAVAPPLTRPAGDLSPRRGDNNRLGEANSNCAAPPALGAVVGAADGLFAYVMRCACPPGHDGARGGTVVDHVRLFPIRSGVRWTYRVHEQILPSLNRAKIPARWTDIVIRHDGYADPDVEARKLERNIKILERELIERPDDPFVLFNLGSSAVQQKEYHAALGLLERSLALSAPRDSIVRKLYALIARVHQMTGDSQEALRTCAAGLKLDPQDAELWHRKAVIHRKRGESSEAERSWRRILDLKRPEQYCSFDDGIYGHVTRRNLAVLAAEQGDFAEATRLWEAVLAECPGDRQALAKLVRPAQNPSSPNCG
jgi:Flp pilus assembly protein TadD